MVALLRIAVLGLASGASGQRRVDDLRKRPRFEPGAVKAQIKSSAPKPPASTAPAAEEPPAARAAPPSAEAEPAEPSSQQRFDDLKSRLAAVRKDVDDERARKAVRDDGRR